VVSAVVVLAAVALGWLLWVMLFHGRPLATSELVTYEVKGEHSAEATMKVVRRDADVEASCLVRAQAADHSIVGELTFVVDSSSPASTTLTRTVRTEREATSVSLLGCLTDGQSRRR
jgi:hypothetical protein